MSDVTTKETENNLYSSMPQPCDEKYYASFFQWRKKTAGKWTYVPNEDLTTNYCHGHGYQPNHQYRVAEKVLKNISTILGVALVICLAVESIGISHDSLVEEIMGVQVHFVFHLIVKILQFLLPVMLLMLVCKPTTHYIFALRSKPQCSPWFYFPLIFFGLTEGLCFEMFSGFGKFTEFYEYKCVLETGDSKLIVLYIMIDIIVVNFLKDLFLYGIVLRFMMQFGDAVALVTTVGFALFVAHNPPQFVVTLITAFAASVCTIKARSFYPAYFAGVIARFVGFLLVVFCTSASTSFMQQTATLIVNVILVTTGIAAAIDIAKNLSHYKLSFHSPSGIDRNRLLTSAFFTIPAGIAILLWVTLIIQNNYGGSMFTFGS